MNEKHGLEPSRPDIIWNILRLIEYATKDKLAPKTPLFMSAMDFIYLKVFENVSETQYDWS